MTIEGLAEKSGASTATVTRFVRALGYGGYGEFRTSLSDALKLAMAPVRSLADAHGVAASPYATLIGALKDQAANLDAAIASLDEAIGRARHRRCCSAPSGSSSSAPARATMSHPSSRTGLRFISMPT